ncbi:hypothetical protein X801_04148 [Opisthorchis viverrini]|uniref:Uncharacterized protein n=2 Tax=Opisthorchis viverrini TaxID=6198 RepID=A0A075AIH7_OPIVI|nr:hypothetical protein T265_02160 [Opisthorchis viverrini]KER31654.1 hypothetical protein T265_02160 [Opisthorchis viverrini]OON19977.1 hypothetical protein X801_04148 [Opisthorchis viverrini]
MVWFCTLGGGFSSLGDNCAGAAEVAGKISLMQLRLALEIGSPVIQAKAKLWFAQSLLQRGFLRTSARLLRLVYREWKPRMSKDTPADRRIDLMAVGLWERLRHSWRCRKRHAVVSLQNDVQYVDRRPKRRYRFPDLSALLNSL